MFDFHMHTCVSFDTDSSALDIALAAKKAGLVEICFTDHQDYGCYPWQDGFLICLEEYHRAYDSLSVPGLTIRKGIEIGLADWNVKEVNQFLGAENFDFVIGSVHMVDGHNAYLEGYWQGKTPQQAFARYLEHTLECVKCHNNFDVLGHLTFVAKSLHNMSAKGVDYREYRDIADEILKILVDKGIGLEINTSAYDRIRDFLPSADYLRRYKELGGSIVTVGSDAHNSHKVGVHIDSALTLAKDIFGHVCTFENRKPKFHKL